MTDNAEHTHLDLGNGHKLSWLGTRDDDRRVGAIIDHLKADGTWCAGGVQWDAEYYKDFKRGDGSPLPMWTLESTADDHITISPSILCNLCGDHGFIRDGKWVPA